MPDESVYQVFNYVENSFLHVPIGAHGGEKDTCEDICRWICEKLKIRPLVFSLIGLRIHGDTVTHTRFLAGCNRPSTDRKYDFRVRFKIPDLSCLKTLDQSLFNYYYSQLRYDLLQNRIPEINYQKQDHKSRVLGYSVNDMYRKMIEDNVTLDELRRDIDKYIPRKINREYSLFLFNKAHKEIFEKLSSIRNRDHDLNYVKNVYINDIDNIAPGYLYEEYNAEIPYPGGEQSSRTGKCPVKLRFQPYGNARSSRSTSSAKQDSKRTESEKLVEVEDARDSPGLKVLYSSKWQHVANIDEILSILVEEPERKVNLALEDQNDPYCIHFHDLTELTSFVTCLAGYYRLMCKWTVYLCQEYVSSPSLNRLKELKFHGPIGGKYSTDKIREKNSTPGACIIRQCEENFDTYFVDMLEEAGVIKTYKLIYKNIDDQWFVQRDKEVVIPCNSLKEAFSSLNPAITKVYRLPPSDNDNAPNLLLCRTLPKASPKRLLHGGRQELGQKQTCIVNAMKDLVINRNAFEDEPDGFTQCTQADFLLPNNSKLEVSLKLLKPEAEGKYLKDFLQIADLWASIDSIDIIKLYGMTLYKPISMVLEYGRHRRLDEYLRSQRNVPPTTLIDVAHAVARAVNYLQKHGILHGNIRCASMLVTERKGSVIRAKLSDPGMHAHRDLTKHDLLWIPYEYQDLSPASIVKIRTDPQVDVWACTSTLWEIFSHGRKMHIYKPADFLPTRKWLQTMVSELRDCKQIIECLTYGWHIDPDKRYAPQKIIGLLVHARQLDNYCTVGNGHITPTLSRSNGSAHGGITNMLNGSLFKNSILSMETSEYDPATRCRAQRGRREGFLYRTQERDYQPARSRACAYQASHQPVSSPYCPPSQQQSECFPSPPPPSSYMQLCRTTLPLPNSTIVRTDCTSASSYVSNGSDSELRSNASSGSSSMPLISSNRAKHFSGDSYQERSFYDCPDYIQLGPTSRIIFHETLGEGNYGRVYRGTLEEGSASMPVALKTLHDDRPDMELTLTDFQREVDIMKSLRHKNIVRFIRFIDDPPKFVVLMEYVPQGSLLSFLGYQRYNLQELDLLRMARDIANGMHYLFEKKIVHRDLAARNILVESIDCVKISDFGLAQMTGGSNYYVARNPRELPIRWYAPETLETQKYSFQSDIWSYGVTLYEMFTFGNTPYAEVDVRSAQQLYDLLQTQENILELHDNEYVYEQLMVPCFKRKPSDRLSFQQLLKLLDEIIGQSGEEVI
ncbi:tyrosine-protein kinase hopscotch-like isoform X1 [Anopheles albimanus]|uniref:tyrosine-protein kinase hopscotch-like isoform X1 n=1 Tax=Anopheles albimanus TaxID=7167 RepID=UPI00164184E2|nr:tyrosine-protein kinase hopscotch-like isoform X1 [Anopheles albimanus]